MSIKYFANRIKETSTTSGTGNLVLGGSILGYKTFVSAIGSDKKLTYYVYRQDSNFEWEIGVGYIQVSGGLNILVRERVISSSNSNNFVSFSSGTKFVESIISEDRINTGLLNVVEKSGDFTPEYMPAIYVIDASASGVQVTLPGVSLEDDPISIGFLLSQTSGNVYSQPNAILLFPSGSETINGTGYYDLSIRNDYLQIISLPSQSGWKTLDPIQDATNPYGDDGSIQVKYDGSFSGVNKFNWDFTNSSLLIGGTGTIASANIVLPSNSGSTVVFNEQSNPNNLRVEGSGNTHLLFIDGGANKIAINSSSATDSLVVNSQYGAGITITRSGTGPNLLFNNTTVSGLTTNDILGSIIFSGLNSLNNSLQYSRIYSSVDETADSAESASISMEIIKNGSYEEIAHLGASGITIGFNNSNIDGIVIGDVCQNEGDNIVLGYYQNICGDNCVALGHNATIASGTFGGSIGTNHSSSGNNIWIIGGSGVSVSGDHRVYLAVDNNNHLLVDKSGNISSTAFSTGNQSFNLFNSYSLSGTANQNFNFIFNNSTGSQKTGLLIKSTVTDPTNGSEDSSLTISTLVAGTPKNIITSDSSGIQLYFSSGNNFNVTSSGTYITGSAYAGPVQIQTLTVTGVQGITNSGSFTVYGNTLFNDWVKVNSGLILNYMSTPTGVADSGSVMPTGEDRVHKLLYQQDPNNTYLDSRVRYEPLATSGSFVTPLQLLSSDAEYQFLDPTGTSIVYLPNGTGLYMGKKFDIFNTDNTHSINVRKSGSASNIETILAGRHMSIVHAGDDNWLRIVSSGVN
jgi:hypothetical protein